MGAMRTTLGVVSAVALIGAGAAAVLAAERLPAGPAAAPASVVTEVDVPPGTTTLVCPRPPVQQAPAADGLGAAATPRNVLGVASFPRDGGLPAGPGAVEGAASGTLGGAGAGVYSGPAEGGAVARVQPGERAAFAAGTALWRLDAGDLRGLWAAPCLSPATDMWFVGGATTVGRTAVLELSNPGQTAVTATLAAWGPLGPVDLPISGTLTVAPGATELVTLGVDLVDQERIGLRVTTVGGALTAAVLDTALAGFTPGGVEAVTPTAAPAMRLVIPGVQLTPDTAGEVLQILNPGAEPALVEVELLTGDGTRALPGAITVDPGAVVEIDLAGAGAGEVALRLTSDLPVAAAVQLARGTAGDGGGAAAVERAWAPATPAATSAAVVLPGGVESAARLLLTNAGEVDAAVRLTPWGADGTRGEPREVTVPAGGTLGLDAGELGAPFAVTLAADRPVHAAALFTATAGDGTLLSVVPFTGDADAARTIGVRVSGN